MQLELLEIIDFDLFDLIRLENCAGYGRVLQIAIDALLECRNIDLLPLRNLLFCDLYGHLHAPHHPLNFLRPLLHFLYHTFNLVNMRLGPPQLRPLQLPRHLHHHPRKPLHLVIAAMLKVEQRNHQCFGLRVEMRRLFDPPDVFL